jgi:serine/threonine protein kinase
MEVANIEHLLATLKKSRLLTEAELSTAYRLAPSAKDNPRLLARKLVRQGLVTVWQAQQLLASRSAFHLGRYRLLERIGQGHFGVVFRAQQMDLKRIVALKVLAGEALSEPQTVARFEREVRVAAQLEHANLVRAYDAESAGGVHFLVMEYVPGRNFKCWIDEYGRLPIDFACESVRQAAVALDYVHAQGMVHRDIKPSNLMVSAADTTSTPTVKILDLGLARVVAEEFESAEHRLTKPGHVLGTVDYISPEQIESTKDADIRADIYSLGCTLFKAITGEVPFAGAGVAEKIMARLNNDAPRLTSLRDDVPAELDEVCARMLARDSAERYQTPGEVAEALAPFGMTGEVVVLHAERPPADKSGGTLVGRPAQIRIRELETRVAELERRLEEIERSGGEKQAVYPRRLGKNKVRAS